MISNGNGKAAGPDGFSAESFMDFVAPLLHRTTDNSQSFHNRFMRPMSVFYFREGGMTWTPLSYRPLSQSESGSKYVDQEVKQGYFISSSSRSKWLVPGRLTFFNKCRLFNIMHANTSNF